MSLLFEDSLMKILNESLPNAEECKSYNENAQRIRSFVIKKMKESESDFARIFDELIFPANYMERSSAELPDEIDCYMKLKLPFTMTSFEGFAILNSAAQHPIIHDERICNRCLQYWIRRLLIKVISTGVYYAFGGRIYLMEYPHNGRGYIIAHTISVKEVVPGNREFSFNLIPAFEYDLQHNEYSSNGSDSSSIPLYAVPKFDDKSEIDMDAELASNNEFLFMRYDLQGDDQMLKDQQNLRNSLRLVKTLFNAIKVDHITSFILKRILLDEIEEQKSKEFCNQQVGVILIEMLDIILTSLKEGTLKLYNMNTVPGSNVQTHSLVHFVFLKLISFQTENAVDDEDIAAMFKREYFDDKYGASRSLFTFICDISEQDLRDGKKSTK